MAFLTISRSHIQDDTFPDSPPGLFHRFTTFSPFVRFLPECSQHSTTTSPVCFSCFSLIALASSLTTPYNIHNSHLQPSRMKGCLKLNSTHTPGHDSQGQHHNEHGETHCNHAPTTPSSPTSASSSTTAPSSSTTDAANMTSSQAHPQTHRKCVAFCAEGSETVYPADEWDRTPAEPARKLSYQ